MRIISGKARGTKLYTLEGKNTRPTLDRVKESVGLEAVSRGAKKAILCDNSKEAIEIIKKNIQKTHSEKNIELYHEKFDNVLKNKIEEQIDIVYIDPPYETNFAIETIELLLQKNLLKKIEKLNVKIFDKRKYGRANLILLKKK